MGTNPNKYTFSEWFEKSKDELIEKLYLSIERGRLDGIFDTFKDSLNEAWNVAYSFGCNDSNWIEQTHKNMFIDELKDDLERDK